MLRRSWKDRINYGIWDGVWRNWLRSGPGLVPMFLLRLFHHPHWQKEEGKSYTASRHHRPVGLSLAKPDTVYPRRSLSKPEKSNGNRSSSATKDDQGTSNGKIMNLLSRTWKTVSEPMTHHRYLHCEKKRWRRCRLFGADGVLMFGSGPTVFGLVKQEQRADGL